MTDGITNSKSPLSCSYADLPLMQKKVDDYQSRIGELEKSIKEFETGTDSKKIANQGLLALRLIAATAEAFVDMASNFIPQKLAGKSVKAAQQLNMLQRYKGFATPVGEAAAGVFDGRGFYEGTVDAIAKGGGKSDVEKCLSEFSSAVSKTFSSGLANDQMGVLGAVAKSLKGVACASAFQVLKTNEYTIATKQVLQKAAESFNVAADTAFTLHKYNSELEKAFDDYLAEDEAVRGASESKKGVIRLLKEQRDRMKKLEAQIMSCREMLVKVA